MMLPRGNFAETCEKTVGYGRRDINPRSTLADRMPGVAKRRKGFVATWQQPGRAIMKKGY